VLIYRREHLRKQTQERDNVEDKKYAAQYNLTQSGQPTSFYMGADAMTDSRSKQPKTANEKGSNFPVSDLAHRCMGVEVVCGPIVGTFLYYTDDFIQKGSNLMVEVMRRAISKLRELLAEKGLELPKKGTMSYDNSGENKNRTLLAYFELLVENRHFDEIEVFFLIVGHTHTPLDQFFSCLSR
jgi:hypothetical protein